jgi:hypothetical protein
MEGRGAKKGGKYGGRKKGWKECRRDERKEG